MRTTYSLANLLICATTCACSAAIYDVREYGAVGDGKVNDVRAVRKTIQAACEAGGGTVYLPGPAQYLLRVSGPGKGDILDEVGPNSWAVLWIWSDNISIRCDNGTTVYVVADRIPSSTKRGGPRVSLFHFGPNRTDKRRHVISFRLEGGRYLMSSAPGALLEGSGFNRWSIRGGAVFDSVWRDSVFIGFPQGGLNEGLKRVDGMQVENTLFDRCHFLDWGGGSHDNLFYVQGNATFRDCHFETSRENHSHAIYTGGDRPGLKLIGCTFRGVRGSRGYPLHLYGESGGPIRNVDVSRCSFEECNSLLVGYRSKAAQDVRLNQLRFVGGGGVRAERVTSMQISDCQHADIELVQCSDVAVSNCGDVSIAVSGQELNRNVRISNCSFPRKRGGGSSHLHIGPVAGCVVHGNTFDTTDTHAWGVFMRNNRVGCRDVVLRGNTFLRRSDGPSLVYLSPPMPPESIIVADNIFRVSTGGSVLEAVSGSHVTIRGNHFACSETPNKLISVSIQAESGPWRIEGNTEVSNARSGEWRLKAPNVSLINNDIQHGIRGTVERDVANRVASPRRAPRQPQGRARQKGPPADDKVSHK